MWKAESDFALVTANQPHSHRVVARYRGSNWRGRRWRHLDTTVGIFIVQNLT